MKPSESNAIRTPADLNDLHDLCRLRSTLEAFAVSRWRKKATRAKILKKLYVYQSHLRKAAVRTDYSAFHDADTHLHREAVTACGIPSLLKSWELVVADLDAWILHVQQVYWPSLMSLYREHELLLEAWNSPDSWVAEQATHQHLEAGWYRLAAKQEDLSPEIDPVDRAASFISTHFASNLDVDWIARNVSFVSASHLTRLFRKKLSVSPYAFLRQVRLERAAELVKSSPEEVSTIAHRVGYKNVSHFVRDFRKRYEMTPLAFRRNSQK